MQRTSMTQNAIWHALVATFSPITRAAGWEGRDQTSQGYLEAPHTEEAKQPSEPKKMQPKLYMKMKRKKATPDKTAATKPPLGPIGSLSSENIAKQIADPLGESSAFTEFSTFQGDVHNTLTAGI